MSYDARLEKWSIAINDRLFGRIFDDSKKRFHDGSEVTTTTIVKGIAAEGTIVETKSGTRYLLGRKA